MSDERFGGVEPSDINDKDILEKTRQAKSANGSIQFKYKCEDGHEIKSEWINPDQARKALIIWCDVVRQTVSSRAKDLAASKQKSAIILPEDIDETEIPEEDFEEAPPPPPKKKAALAPVKRQPEPVEEDDLDEDELLLRTLRAKRKKLAAKIAKIDMILEALED